VSSSAKIWMPLDVGDYLADTRRLTTEHHGAYLLLIMEYWQKGTPLPDDDDQLGQITGLGKRFKAARVTLQQFFKVEDGQWRHGRVEEEQIKANKFVEKSRINGAKGGRPKEPRNNLGVNLDLTQTYPRVEANPNLEKTPSPSPSPLGNTHTARAGELPAWAEVETFSAGAKVDADFARDWFERKINSLTHGFNTLRDWRFDLLTYWRRGGAGQKPAENGALNGRSASHGRAKSLGAEVMDAENTRKRTVAQMSEHPCNELSASYDAASEEYPAWQALLVTLRSVEGILRSIPKDAPDDWQRRLRAEAFQRELAQHPGNPQSTAYDEAYCTPARQAEFLALRKEAV